MDVLKVAQALRPDLNIVKADGPLDCPDGMKQWWFFSPNENCVGNILAQSYYRKDETTGCVMHKLDISLTIFE